VVGLFIAGFAGAMLVLCTADRVLKARVRARRLRTMSDRLATATATADVQQERRQVAAQASVALTSILPAIERPPLTVPAAGQP
jgi:hypothetical protein